MDVSFTEDAKRRNQTYQPIGKRPHVEYSYVGKDVTMLSELPTKTKFFVQMVWSLSYENRLHLKIQDNSTYREETLPFSTCAQALRFLFPTIRLSQIISKNVIEED